MLVACIETWWCFKVDEVNEAWRLFGCNDKHEGADNDGAAKEESEVVITIVFL